MSESSSVHREPAATPGGEPSPALAGALSGLARHRSVSLAGLADDERDLLARHGVCVGADRAALAGDVELLSGAAIRDGLDGPTRQWLRDLRLEAHIGSTNTTLLDLAADGEIDGRVVAAEVQTAGRGRRGRGWLSPFGRNLAVSIGLGVARGPAELGALSLVVGLAVRDALQDVGVTGVELKWPNDVLLDGRKLGGILLELVRATAPVEVVAGIGINIGGAGALAGRVDQAVADVSEQLSGPCRNALFVRLLCHVVAAARRFEADGFAPFRRPWESAHRYQGRTVTVSMPVPGQSVQSISGVVLGVAEDGALRLRTESGMRRFNGGEVSVREAQ